MRSRSPKRISPLPSHHQPEAGAEVFVPSGEFPTPNQELAGARPYRASSVAPESFLAWPLEIDSWGDKDAANSSWAEEAFAKACAEPKVFVPAAVVLSASRECGSSNFAGFMQTRGFRMDRKVYLDGPFRLIGWTNAADLNGAIAHVGPVKIGVASANLASPRGEVTPGTSGWAIHGLPARPARKSFARAFAATGRWPALVPISSRRRGVTVHAPSGMPTGLCYAMFTWGSIGIVDRQSLMNITGEAWVRNPTTIVRNLSR